MTVSICMITYNHQKFIAQSIEGIIGQETDFPYKLIIGEDSSSDGTRAICEEFARKYPDKITLLDSDKRYGAMENLIRVIRKCDGDYIAVCEGDDYWIDKKKLQKQVSFLEKNQDFGLCCHDAYFEINGKKTRSHKWDTPADTDLEYLLKKGNFMVTLSVILRKYPGLIEFLEGFRHSPVGDYLLYLHTAQHGKIHFLKDYMGVYRVHNTSMWSSLQRTQHFSKYFETLTMLYQGLPESFRQGLRIQVMGTLEDMVGEISDEMLETPQIKDTLQIFRIPADFIEYVKFNSRLRSRPSYFAQNVPLATLIRAIKEKLKNNIPPIRRIG